MNVRQLGGFALGPVAVAFFGAISVPLVAWLFQPEDIGRFNILQIVIQFGTLFLALGLDQAFVREFHEAPDQARLLRECALPGLALGTLATIALAPYARDISKALYGTSDLILYVVTGASVIFSLEARFLSLILRMQERGLAYSLSQVLPKVFLLLGLAGIAYSRDKPGFVDLTMVYLTTLSVVLIYYAWNTRAFWIPSLKRRIDRSSAGRLLRFGLPLVFSGLASWSLAASSTFSLRRMAGLADLGIWSVAVSFSGAGVILQSVFTTVWSPTVYKWVAKGGDMSRVDDVMNMLSAVASLVFAILAVFAWMTDLVLPEAYSEVKYLFAACVTGPLMYTLSEVPGVGLGITRRSLLTLWPPALAVLVNVTGNALLIPRVGVPGAAVSYALAFTTFFAARTELSARVWRPMPRARTYAVVVVSAAGAVVTALWGPRVGFPLVTLYWAAAGPALALMFRPEWTIILRQVRVRSVLRRTTT